MYMLNAVVRAQAIDQSVIDQSNCMLYRLRCLGQVEVEINCSTW